MIPILYESNETAFTNNGLGRLRDCISCVVTEERNGIYECDFEYPVGGINYDLIKIGRIICVSHDASMIAKPKRSSGALTDEAEDILTDENGIALTASRTIFGTDYDVQPFDIVSFTRPIDGIVTFHCVHVSYRQSYMTVNGSNINSLANALSLLSSAEPTNPFTYQTDIVSNNYLASADGVPKSVRSMLGGIEGSILDAYGGEYEWDRFNVILHSARGTFRDFSIRYGVNMLDYNEELDSSGTYMSCVPYWTDGTTTIVGDRQISNGSTITGRGECVPLDVSEKFENQPTKAEVEAMGLSVMNASNPMIPAQTISVEFVRLQDMGYDWLANLYDCRLCDTIKVVFPFYDTVGQFKIVKTVWDVLSDRYESMELGDLSVTLAEALGISSSGSDQNSNEVTAYGAITGQVLDDKSVISGTSWVEAGNFTLPSGIWMVTVAVQFEASATGTRQMTLGTASATAGTVTRTIRAAASPTGATSLVLTTPAEGGKYYINVVQNSGSAKTVNLRYTAVKLGSSVVYA